MCYPHPSLRSGWGTRPDYVFFSFVTLTTVGYGDIIPLGGHAKALAVLEAVSGIMYPAILIGRLIAVHGRKTSAK